MFRLCLCRAGFYWMLVNLVWNLSTFITINSNQVKGKRKMLSPAYNSTNTIRCLKEPYKLNNYLKKKKNSNFFTLLLRTESKYNKNVHSTTHGWNLCIWNPYAWSHIHRVSPICLIVNMLCIFLLCKNYFPIPRDHLCHST